VSVVTKARFLTKAEELSRSRLFPKTAPLSNLEPLSPKGERFLLLSSGSPATPQALQSSFVSYSARAVPNIGHNLRLYLTDRAQWKK